MPRRRSWCSRTITRRPIIGSQEMSQQFAAQGHLPYTRTIIGGGPNGETVVYEVNKKEPAYADRLMARFKAQQ